MVEAESMATAYPAARNLCAAATSRWCSEHLHAYNNYALEHIRAKWMGGMWGECEMRETANSGLAASSAAPETELM